MQRPTFQAHALLLASLLLLLQALFNALHCFISVDWKAVIAAVYRAGMKARHTVYVTRLRFRATRIALYRTRNRLVATTTAQLTRTQECIAYATDTARIFAELATAAGPLQSLPSDCLTAGRWHRAGQHQWLRKPDVWLTMT